MFVHACVCMCVCSLFLPSHGNQECHGCVVHKETGAVFLIFQVANASLRYALFRDYKLYVDDRADQYMYIWKKNTYRLTGKVQLHAFMHMVVNINEPDQMLQPDHSINSLCV